MTNITHASIVPLIGGMTIAQQQVFGGNPEYLVSYKPFMDNEKHLINYYKTVRDFEIPYHIIEETYGPKYAADVINATCPCAGLSMMSSNAGPDNEWNEWMYKTTEYVLGELGPKVFWGENAPTFATNLGKPVRDKLYNIGRKYGYSMTVYKTKSLLHGLPQIRPRSFYFFWKGDKAVPINFYNKKMQTFENLLTSIKSNFQQDLVNKKVPSQQPVYRYILEEVHGGISHKKFIKEKFQPLAKNSMSCEQYLTVLLGVGYDKVADWMQKEGYESEYVKFARKRDKIAAGGGVMQRNLYFTKDYINSFAGWLKESITHPLEDRFLTYRECMSLMGLPEDFELLEPKRSINHIAQNVPVGTASDMAESIKDYLEGRIDPIDTTYIMMNNENQKIEYLKPSEKTTLMSFV
jgi:site-specific DNA-cytosine methylase